jgi:hypothetical protein
MKKPNSHLGLYAVGALAAASLIACGGGGGDSGGSVTPPPPVTTFGTLGVALTDAPACGFDAVNITVNKVRVHQSAAAGENDSGWTDITLSPARKINLLNLTNGALESLGQTPLAAGHYSQLRLVLDPNTGLGLANSVVPSDKPVEQSLDTPSAVQSGIKLVNEFDVVAGQRVDLVLDFDACKSVISKGNGQYALKPVVKVIPTVINGISGVVSSTLLGSHVMVSAQQNGVIVSSTAPNPVSGEFFLARLVPGTYDVVITADNRAATVIGAVPVASSTSTTALSTAAAPLTMALSTMGSIGGVVTLTPASATEAAYVAARQSFAAGPTVVIKYQGAGLVSGAYTLANLPVAAPQYAVYNASLPLVFTPALTVAPGVGKYRVDASAIGYATKSQALVDISTLNQTNVNFALTP